MSRLVFVSLIIIFITSAKGKSFLSIAKPENGKTTSLNSSREADFSSDIDVSVTDLKNSEEDDFTDFQRIKFYDSAQQYTSENLEQNSESGQNEDMNNLKIDLINSHSSQPLPSSKRMTTDKEIIDYLSAAYRTGYGNYRDYEEPEFIWPSIRREINNAKGFHDLIEPDSAPWNFEFHNRRVDSDSYRQNYFQKNSYPKNFNLLQNDSFMNGYQKPTEYNYDPPIPQYIQKKNYNNFYVIIPNGKLAAGCNTEEVITFESDSKRRGNFDERKLTQKIDWDQYLQFLKAAFQKLDEDPYYYYDENEHDDYGSPDKMRFIAQPPLQTYLLGPTLYVDNSGKISQSNFHGTSFQNIGGVSANSKFTPVTFNYFKHEPTVKTDEDWKSLFQNQNNNVLEQTTTDHSSVAPTESNNPTEIITTESTMRNDLNFRYGPYNQEILRRFSGDNFKTTVQTATEETHSLKNLHTTYYPTTEYTTEKKDDSSPISIFAGNTDSTRHPYPHWLTIVDFQTPQPTLPPQTSTWILRKESDFIDLTKTKEDVDCNDKMLPCPDTVNVTYPLNGYCNRYVSCESGRAIRRLCSDGLHFNPITKSCDLPHNSICTYACPKPHGIYGIPGDCGGYFVCKNSILEYRMCPPKMHWDIKREQCIFEELSSCPMKCDGGNKIKSYEGDCKGYIICLQNTPYYHKCPPNTKFDQVTQTCIPEHQSHCKDDPKLLVKTLNPNVLCNNIMKKLSTKSWCEYFSANKITTTYDTE